MSTPIARFAISCQTKDCPNFCVTADRDPRPWACPTCEDLALEEHVRYLEALSLTRSPHHHSHTNTGIAS